ncbi:MAG: hypothetical protein J7621_09845 [Niastella sp.]|nr:hypothetical protein [Niastella sp.]
MKEFFKELFEYGHYFNQQLGVVFIDKSDKTSEKSVKLYNHILNAHQIWNNRINPQQQLFGVWEMHLLQDLKEIELLNYEQSLSILDNFDLSEIVHYTNVRNQAFSYSVRDMLFHAINHTTYHWAQIATEFRNNGIEPLAVDYVLYKRR